MLFNKIFVKKQRVSVQTFVSGEIKTYTSYCFSTERRGEFNNIHAKWYSPEASPTRSGIKFIKRIPPDLGKLLIDPLALAVWYLDDGTKRSDTASCRIATQCFTEEENEIIRATLLNNFGIRSTLERWCRTKQKKPSFQIAILSSKRTGDYDKFRDLLYPIVSSEVPSMLYKLQ